MLSPAYVRTCIIPQLPYMESTTTLATMTLANKHERAAAQQQVLSSCHKKPAVLAQKVIQRIGRYRKSEKKMAGVKLGYEIRTVSSQSSTFI